MLIIWYILWVIAVQVHEPALQLETGDESGSRGRMEYEKNAILVGFFHDTPPRSEETPNMKTTNESQFATEMNHTRRAGSRSVQDDPSPGDTLQKRKIIHICFTAVLCVVVNIVFLRQAII